MKTSKEIFEIFGWSNKTEDFIIGNDSFSDLKINSTPERENFYYFYSTRDRRLIKQFILLGGHQVDYICEVILIKKDDKFTPRLTLVVRDKNKKNIQHQQTKITNIKARVGLDRCHENFWKLINYLNTVQGIDIPKESFSLITESEANIVSALKDRKPESIIKIIKDLSDIQDIKLSEEDINQLLKRKEKLEQFKRGLNQNISDESKWQVFFETNKWIFGYGLDYKILKEERTQPYYGGTGVDSKGGQKGDYLVSTTGNLNFTVLVEIKTPATPLLQGSKEIRNGAWSLSKDLMDAVAQIQANIQTWDKNGSREIKNIDELETKRVAYTVKPKGIIVIGSLDQLIDDRNKWETFQRFRQSVNGIDIITFDELYHRAKFIVEYKG